MIKHPMRKTFAAALALLLLCPPGAVAPLWAQPAGKSGDDASDLVTVDDLVVAPDQVIIKLSDKAQYQTAVTQNPPRLIVDLLGTQYQAPKKVAGQGKYLKDVRGAQFAPLPSPVSRVVLDLSEIPGYKIIKQGSDLVVALGPAASQGSGPAPAAAKTQAEGAPKAPASTPAKAAAAAPAAKTPAKPAAAKTAAAKPAVKAKAKPVVKVPAKPAASQIAAAAPVSKEAQKPGSMSTANNPELVAMAAKKSADAEAGASAPQPPARAAAASRPSERGGDILDTLPRDPISLDFENTDIRQVLNLLSTKAGINIIYGPDVTGTLTLHLSHVPFGDAFRTVLMMSGLTTTQIGDHILRVLTPNAAKEAQTSGGFTSKVITLNYAKAAELLPTLNAIRQAEGRQGAAQADAKTNSIVLTDSPEGLAASERIVEELDQRPKQVLIEAKLVEVGLNNSLNYGIQWDYLSLEQGHVGGKQGLTTVGGALGPADPKAITLPLDQNAATITPAAGQLAGAGGRGTGVNLPASTIFGAMTLGRVTNNYFINATLTAAAAEGKVKVLSDPKIATLNNQVANINVTTQIPYVTSNVASTGVQTQTVSYAITGIQLSVTPTINADGRVTLLINPNVSQPSATAAASVTTGAPAIDSRNASTTVIVQDGETIVIGGLIADSVSNQIAKIPLLGDIPILGWLFKKKTLTRTRAELLIFVTTKILPD